MQVSKSIFLYGHDSTLLYTRHLLLKNAGFHVSSGSDLVDVQSIFSSSPADLLVLCQTVSPDEGMMVIAVANAFNPKASVLSLSDMPFSHAFVVNRNAPVSVIGDGLVTASTLLTAIREALDIQARSEND